MHPNNIYSSAISILGQISKNTALFPYLLLISGHASLSLFYLAFIYIKALSEKYFWIFIVLYVPNIVFLKQKLNFYFPFLYCFLSHESLVSASYTSVLPCGLYFLVQQKGCTPEKSSALIVIVPNLSPTFPLKVGNLSPSHFMF